MAWEPVLGADPKKYCLCNFVMILATLGPCIGQMASDWISYDKGRVSLWKICIINLNETDIKGNHPEECFATASKGPAWLEACRTMACFSIVFYLAIFYVFYYKNWYQVSTGSLLGQIKARSAFICYFMTGSLMLTNAIVYNVNYYDYYSDDEELDLVHPTGGFYIAYIGGTISVVNCIFLSSRVHTGFVSFVKYKLYNCKCTCFQWNSSNSNDNRQSNDNDEAQQGIEVRSRFAVFASALKRCGRGMYRKPCGENTAASSTNHNTQITSSRRITNGLSEGPGSNLPRVFVIDSGEGNLALPNPERSSSVASVSRLEVEIRSLSGDGQSNDETSSSPSNPPPPPYSSSQPTGTSQGGHDTAGITTEGQRNRSTSTAAASEEVPSYADIDDNFYRDGPPPSYEEVMRGISKC